MHRCSSLSSAAVLVVVRAPTDGILQGHIRCRYLPHRRPRSHVNLRMVLWSEA